MTNTPAPKSPSPSFPSFRDHRGSSCLGEEGHGVKRLSVRDPSVEVCGVLLDATTYITIVQAWTIVGGVGDALRVRDLKV
ncbi:unnamed protein product [Ectocarpus sp. 12 AP-2014]